jgi:LPS export ABC transporter protein LptC
MGKLKYMISKFHTIGNFFSKRSIFSAFSMAIIVGVTSILSIESVHNYHSEDERPGNFVTTRGVDVQLYQINSKGRTEYKTNSQRAVSLEDGRSKLYKNELSIYGKGSNIPWVLVSDVATISKGNNILNLEQYVNLSRKEDKKSNHPPINIYTNQAYVYPKKNFVETDKPVKITQPGSKNIITGIGMRATLNPVVIEVKSRVRGYYGAKD